MADASIKVLNEEQLQAVEHGEGPLLIIAGAGTGKTTVVTERVKYLIVEKKISPSEVLALTFTEKAAREMEERIDVALPLGYANMWISTFHAFGDRILRDEAINIGLGPHYRVMTQAESVQFLRKRLFKLDLDYFRPLGNPNKFVEGLLQHFSRLKDEDVAVEEYFQYLKELKKEKNLEKNKKLKENEGDFEEISRTEELAKAYQKYEELKFQEGLLDFGDLMNQLLRLFRTRPKILATYQQKFKYILVDEFQDTNFSQYALIKLLAPPPKSNLTVVGDDNQCLPGSTEISLFEGKKRIDQIRAGDIVLTAVGKGHTSCSKVTKVFKNWQRTKLLTFTLETGEKVTVTDNHKMFCYVPCREKRKDFHFVYLMRQEDLGWRIGVTNDLATRLRLELHADGLLAIGSYKTDQEARFYESFYSAKYGIPTVPFSPRQGQAVAGEWLERLFREINTERKAGILANQLGLDLDSFSVNRNGVVRGVSERVKVNFQMCYRNYRSKTHKEGFVGSPFVQHMVNLETSSPKAIQALENSGFHLTKARKGKRLRFTTQDISKAWRVADEIVNLTGGFLEKKFTAGTENLVYKPANIVPAGNVFPGSYLPVLVGKKIVYKKVIKRDEEEKELEVYDLEIENTHNFIANKVVVHNSIYKFRGAAISNILQFKKDYPKAKSVVLNQNYRSTQTILDAAYRLIKNNDPDTLEASLGISKRLEKVREVEETPVEFLMADRVENEAEMVVKTIENCKLQIENLKWSDFAILIRANSHAEPFIRALGRAGIPAQFLGPGMLFRQPEIKDLISYLLVLYNFEDSIAMYRLLSMEHFGLHGRDLASLLNFSRKRRISLFEACEEVIATDATVISPAARETIGKLVGLIHQHLDLAKSETAGRILYLFLNDTGLFSHLAEVKTVEDEKRVQNITKFFDKLKVYETDHEDASVLAVVDYINLSLELGESPLVAETDWTENNAVNLLTVHSAKGLEFPVVFMVNLVNRRFPPTERPEPIPIPEALIKEILPQGDYRLEEERRLFYVGMTRARDRLYFTAANFYGEEKQERKVSPFAAEALGSEEIKKLEIKKLREAGSRQLSLGWGKKEEQPITSFLNYSISSLSYSQIETFDLCPLKYRFAYILFLPTPLSGALSFGSAIHETMRDFYQRAIAGQKPTKGDLLQILAENWIPVGYSSREQQQRYKKQGEKILGEFFEKTYNPKVLPMALEQSFAIRVGPTLKILGKIDRIDRVKQGIEIIDYKTGKSSTKKGVGKDLQLSLYALVAVDGILTYTGILKQIPKPEEVTVSFYFFDNQEKISSTRTKEDLEKVKGELLEKAKAISESNFSPTPGKHCDFCEFRLLCEAWK